MKEVRLLADAGLDLRAAESRFVRHRCTIRLGERQTTAMLEHAGDVGDHRPQMQRMVQGIHNEDDIECTGTKRHIAHVRAHAVIRHSSALLKQSSDRQVMIDVNGGAVEPSSRHLTGGPRQISPQVKCTLAGSKVEMCEEKIESRDGGSDVCEYPGSA